MHNKHKEYGVEPLGKLPEDMKFHFNNKYPYNKKCFSELNKDSAYWIGFWSADGYILKNRLHLVLSEKDIDVLHKWKGFICSPDRPIRKFDNHGYPAAEVRIRSWELVKSIEKYKLHINKPDRGRLHIDLLQESIRKHFVRGYFDGDGCFTVDKRGYLFAEIMGYPAVMQDIKNILVTEGIVPTGKKLVSYGKLKRIRLNARESFSFGEWIYTGYPDIFYLSRKRNIYNAHVKRLNEATVCIPRENRKEGIRLSIYKQKR